MSPLLEQGMIGASGDPTELVVTLIAFLTSCIHLAGWLILRRWPAEVDPVDESGSNPPPEGGADGRHTHRLYVLAPRNIDKEPL